MPAVDLPTRVPKTPEGLSPDDEWPELPELTKEQVELLELAIEGIRRIPSDGGEPTTPPRWDAAAEQAMRQALTEVLKHQKHRSVEQRGQPRTARIVGYGAAGPEGSHNHRTASWLVNDVAGTMALATSTLSPIAAETAVQAFDRSVNKATRKGVRPKRRLQNALQHDIPAVIDRTRALNDQSIPEPDIPETLGVQIIGNQLLYGGGHTLVVHNLETNTYTWLTPSTRDGTGRHTLGPGRHIVLMHTDSQQTVSADVISAHIRDGLRRPLPIPVDMSPNEWIAREPAMRSRQLAEHVRQRLMRGGAHTSTRVLASIVEVTGEPSGSPMRHLSNLNPVRMMEWISAAAHIRLDPYREQRLALGATLWQRGGRYRLGSLGIGLIGLPGMILTSRFAPGVAHDVGYALALTDGSEATGLETSNEAVAKTSTATAAFGLAHHATIPDVPAPPAERAAPEFHDGTYTATSHDAGNGGHASNITNMARQSLAFYGKQAGLSEAQIRELQHNQTVLDGSIDAFVEDKADADNGRVVNYPQMWVLNGTGYSLHDMNTYDKQAVATYAQQHGVTPPTAPAAPATPTEPAQPAQPTTPPAITPSPGSTPSTEAAAAGQPPVTDPSLSPSAEPAAGQTSDTEGLPGITHDAAKALRQLTHNKIMLGSAIAGATAILALGLLWPRRPRAKQRAKQREAARALATKEIDETDATALRVTAQVGQPITPPAAPAPDPQSPVAALPTTSSQGQPIVEPAVPAGADPTVVEPDDMQVYADSEEPGHVVRSHRLTREAKRAGRTPPVVPKSTAGSRRYVSSARIGRPDGSSDGHVG